MGPRPQYKTTTRCLWAVLHIVGPITVPSSLPYSELACIQYASHMARNLPLSKAALSIYCCIIYVKRNCMSVPMLSRDFIFVQFRIYQVTLYYKGVLILAYTVAIAIYFPNTVDSYQVCSYNYKAKLISWYYQYQCWSVCSFLTNNATHYMDKAVYH